MLATILANIAWATGGGMINLILDRIARYELSEQSPAAGDVNLAWLLGSVGAGLFIGMLLARRAGAWASSRRRASLFIGWTYLAHGVCFALAGLMPGLLLLSLLVALSRVLVAVEFGLHETLMMRALPDEYRGRVFTADRALELTTMSLSTMLTGWLLLKVEPRVMMIVSGLLSGLPGLFWLLAMWRFGFEVPDAALPPRQEANQ